MVTLSARIEDPMIQRSLGKKLHRRKRTWRLVWIGLVVLIAGAAIYGYLRFAEYGQVKVTQLLEQGRQAETRFELTAALESYTQAIALGSVAPEGAAEAAFRAAALFTGKSDHAQAQSHLLDAERLQPDVALYSAALGRSYLSSRSIGLAGDAFDRALEADTEYAPAYVGKARVALAHLEAEPARLQTQKALELAADNQEAQLLAAILLVHQDPSRSAELLRELRGSTKNKGYSATAAELQEVLDRLTDTGGNLAYDYTLVGSVLLANNELDGALLELTAATDEDPEYRDGWVNRAQAHVLLGQLDEAQAAIETALKIDPTFGFSRFVQGQVYQARGDLSRAQDAYERAIEQRYQEPQVYLVLADVLRQRTEDGSGGLTGSPSKAAVELLQSAIDGDIRSDDLYDQLFWLYVEQDKPKQALKIAQQYVIYDERGTTAQGLLAFAQLTNGAEDQARETANDLVARDPLSAIGAYLIGTLDNDPILLQKAIDLDQGGRIEELARARLDS
ncbi:MAG: tetratricopeptide repeat protein [bacterium]|nr:tetratricopeptide repeat protein [bacterium]